MRKTFFFIVPVLVCLALFLWRTESREIRTREAFVTDVFVDLKARGTRRATDEAFRRAMQEIRRVDARFGYKDSLITGLNENRLLKDREGYGLISLAKAVREASGGSFSVTLRPILEAWGFTGSHPCRIPAPGQFDSWKKAPQDEGVVLKADGVTVELPEGTGVDIGGLIEGYAGDRAREAMLSAGCDTGLVTVGGEVVAFGDRTWRIAVKDPRGEGVLGVIPLKNRAIATSGDYERFFFHRGRRFCHILDPATGWPAQGLMSASVIADTCTLANAWAVALFVAGPDRIGAVLERKGFDWVVVDRAGKIRTSPGMRGFFPGSREAADEHPGGMKQGIHN